MYDIHANTLQYRVWMNSIHLPSLTLFEYYFFTAKLTQFLKLIDLSTSIKFTINLQHFL